MYLFWLSGRVGGVVVVIVAEVGECGAWPNNAHLGGGERWQQCGGEKEGEQDEEKINKKKNENTEIKKENKKKNWREDKKKNKN